MVDEDDIVRISQPRRDGPENRALDAWLRRELSNSYDGVLSEPLTPGLLALLRPQS